MDELENLKIDKKALSVASLLQPSDEKAYWLSKTPSERLPGGGVDASDCLWLRSIYHATSKSS